MAVTYPGGAYRPLGPQTQPRMRAHEVICLHTMVGFLRSTDDFFRDAGYGGTESHFGVGGKWGSDGPLGLDGAVWQWQDLEFTADANYEGNDRVISIETADNAPRLPQDIEAWTPKQCDAIVQLVAWLCARFNIPPVLVPDTRPGTRGIGYHAQGTAVVLPAGAERWSVTKGKPCPTARRIAQIRTVIIPRVQAALRGEPIEEDPLMALTDSEQDELLRAARQINGAVASGKADFASTVEGTLAAVQGLVNQLHAGNTALARSIADTRTAVLGAVAALPTDHLSDADRQQLAGDIAVRLGDSGVQVDVAAVLDALAARLAA